MRKVVAIVAVAGLLFAACGGDGDGGDTASNGDGSATPDPFATAFVDAEVYPIFVSSEIVVGENRFLIGLLDENDAPIGSPDVAVEVAFYDLDSSSEDPVTSEEARWVWLVEEQNRGLYVTYPSFEHDGRWGAEVSITGGGFDERLKGSFDVAKASTTPEIGDRVPASDTPTASSAAEIKKISTDDDPDPDFYKVSIAEALEKGEPFVVVFATPKFCTSAVCGPTLDDVEGVAKDFPNITFIHSEIYEGNDPANPPVQAVTEWGLPSEPWVFVVGSDGRLIAKFEGSAPPEELTPILQDLQ